MHWSGWTLFGLGWVIAIALRTFTAGAQPVRLGWLLSGIGWFLAALAFLAGVALITRARKQRASSAHDVLAADPRPPVLYLRSFKDDGPDPVTESFYTSGLLMPSPEERLAIAMRRIGPFVAVGRPGERLPELGAARLYVNADEWQSTISSLIARSQLIVLRAGNTDGFWWEAEQVLSKADRNRVLFFFGPDGEGIYQQFRKRAVTLLPGNLPERIGKAQFLYFENAAQTWIPRTITLRVPRLNFMGNSAIEEMFFRGLRPIFERLGVPVPRHSFPLTYKLGIAFAGFAVVLGVVQSQLHGMLGDARDKMARSKLLQINSALQAYYVDTGRYPTEEQGLKVLVQKRLVGGADMLDPWGRPFVYRLGAAGFELFSLGADGVEGGDGTSADIRLSR